MRRVGLVLALAAAGCSGRGTSLDLVFSDPTVRPLVSEVMLTVVEPFVPSDDPERTRELLECGELGVFKPTARYSRDASELAEFPSSQVILNRERSQFPFEGEWTLPAFKVNSSPESNPWGAVLLHVEGRGLARKTEEGVDEEIKTLLEGCLCVRLNPGASSDDAKLDAEVKQSCAPLESEDGTARQLQLRSVAPQQFKLVPCGITDLTAAKNDVVFAHPGVCVETVRCDEQGGQACFRCRSDTCSELTDLRNVPVRVEVTQPGGASAPAIDVILSDVGGVVVPEVQVDGCSVPLEITTQILGRPETKLDFPVRCVDPIAFGGPDQAAGGMDLTAKAIAGIGVLPEDRTNRSPQKVAVLTQTFADGARIELFEAGTGALRSVAALELANERPLGIFGYYYRVAQIVNGQRIETPDVLDHPILAVATAFGGAPRIRLYRWDEGQDALVLLREMTGICAFNGCGQPGQCAGVAPCEIELRNASISMSAADVNGDGLADLSFAADTSYALTIFLSTPDATEVPPALAGSCQCSSFGRLLPSYELLQIGGPGENPLSGAVDLIMGDTTGAYLRYGLGEGVQGTPCSTTSSASACPAGLECVEMCAGAADERTARESGRCVRRCNGAPDSCGGDPVQPICVPDDGRTRGRPGFCGGAYLTCSQPQSVWRLINIHDVTRARISGSSQDDLIAVGSGSPLPVSAGTGFVRLFYPSAIDLTLLDAQPASVRKTASTDLVPRAQEDTGEARSPRAVEAGDFNGDGMSDVAVLFEGSEEIRIWLGSGGPAPAEIQGRVRLNTCSGICARTEECRPFRRFATPDLDGDGKSELVAICQPDQRDPLLYWFRPGAPQ